MKRLTVNQKTVDWALRRSDAPLTIREIAEVVQLPISTVRTAVFALVRHGAAEQKGTAFSGGVTFAALGDRGES